MTNIFWIAAMGALGVLSRYGIDQWATAKFNTEFPVSTFMINLLGSFLIGFIFVAGFEKAIFSRDLTLTLSIGFLGGFTTFSAFSLQSLQLFEQKQFTLAALYILGSPAFGILSALAGISLGRALLKT